MLEVKEAIRLAAPLATINPASRIASGAADTPGPADTTTDRARPSALVLATFGERITVAERTYTDTPGEISLAERGVKEDYLVGMTGFEPATLRSQSGNGVAQCYTSIAAGRG
jgi:hypothetical protein